MTSTPALVKQLRDMTGVGMSKCKEALVQTEGNIEEAISFLRKAGMTSAAKKEGRVATEGMIAFHEGNETVSLVEVNAETDFVVKNDKFRQFCQDLAEEVSLKKPTSLEEFVQQPYSKDPQLTVDQYRSLLIQMIGENIQIRRIASFDKGADLSIGVYAHLGGKILSVLVLQGSGEEELARNIAMHVAATAPEFLVPEDVPQEIVQKEQEIARTQVAGKPEHIIEQILDGKLKAFFELCCLTKQKYIRDNGISVEEFLGQQAVVKGKELRIVQYLRWAAGK